MEREEIGLSRGRRAPGPLLAGPLAALAEHAQVRAFARGALLFEEGDPTEQLHVLLDGSVVLCAGEGRRPTVIELARPVGCLDLEPVLGRTPRQLSARGLEAGRVLVVAAAEVRERVAHEPTLALALLDQLAARGRRLVGQVKDLKLRSGPQRLGCCLLRLIDEQGDGEAARLAMPKGILAQLLGMTAESLSRAFAALRREGVEVQGSRVRVVDRARLELFCRPGARGRG